jgi:hypothetical protein
MGKLFASILAGPEKSAQNLHENRLYDGSENEVWQGES